MIILPNNRTPWTEQETAELLLLIREGMLLRLIRLRLGRTQAAILNRIQQLRREEIHV